MQKTTQTPESTIDLTSPPGRTRQARVLALPFVGYLLYFVGIGQIAGGVVHYPIDPAYFTMMAIIGVFVFLAGTWLNEIVLPVERPSGRQIARLVGAAVVLSMGVGGVSGGVQHFLQFPTRSAILISAGLILAFLGFVWKGSLSLRQSLIVGSAVVVAAAVTLLALQPLVASIEGVGGGHDHSHAAGEAQSSDNTARSGA